MFPDQYPKTEMLYPTSEWNVALLWRIPLRRLFFQGDLKKYDAQLSIQQNRLLQQKATIQEEVLSAQNQLRVIEEQLAIAREGSALAREAVSRSMQRQQLGTVRPLEILQAQEIYIRSRLDELQAVAEFNKQQYRLYVATGNDL
jgi:outer membrane protein TolC